MPQPEAARGVRGEGGVVNEGYMSPLRAGEGTPVRGDGLDRYRQGRGAVPLVPGLSGAPCAGVDRHAPGAGGRSGPRARREGGELSSGGEAELGGEMAKATPPQPPLAHLHHHEGVELRVTGTFRQEPRADEAGALDELESI